MRNRPELLLSFVALLVLPVSVYAQAIREFPLPPDSHPSAIIAEPDGNLWFLNSVGSPRGEPMIGRMTTAGTVTPAAGKIVDAQSRDEDVRDRRPVRGP